MRTRKLGTTRIHVTELTMGCWEIGGLFWGPIDQFDAIRLLNQAHDAGFTTYDMTDVYGNGRSEALLGRAFGERRKNVTIISKAGYLPSADGAQRLYDRQVQRHTPRYLREACEMSLWRLESDYIDVYLLHDPPMEVIKKDVTWNALRKLKEQGKIRYFGASVNTAGAIECIKQGAEVIETPFNLLSQLPRQELFPLARKHKVGILARSPFSSGKLFQKGKDAAIHPYRFLARKGRSLTDAAIKFSLAQEGVSSVVVGVMRRAETIKNVAACKRPLLTKTNPARIDKLND